MKDDWGWTLLHEVAHCGQEQVCLHRHKLLRLLYNIKRSAMIL